MLIYENARLTNEAIRELRTGGGPGRRLTEDDELVKTHLSGIFGTHVLNDIEG
jgi:hypothetical protein